MIKSVSWAALLALVACGEPNDALAPLPVCDESNPLCATEGYAHFTISNIEGSGLPNEVRYEVSTEVIQDLVTELIWDAGPSSEPMGWEDAKAYCAALERGGRRDFRLPGRIELVTVLDFGEIPVVASVFSDVAADYHFTSSAAPIGEGSAYSVYFGAGETTIAGANPGRARARCVAGPVTSVAEPQLAVSGDVVIDRGTGLEWERTPGAPAPLADAAARCESLGMRLPSIRELQSIVAETRYEPALDVELFEETDVALYWSSTLRGADPWHVDFKDGQTYADRFEDESLASRCVR